MSYYILFSIIGKVWGIIEFATAEEVNYPIIYPILCLYIVYIQCLTYYKGKTLQNIAIKTQTVWPTHKVYIASC